MTEQELRTPIYDWHVSAGARIVDFAGWQMPIQYSSIIDEHVATRTKVGIFDVSHMGRFEFYGEDALTFLDGLTTRRVADTKPGKIRYSLVCQEDGGILDDVLVYALPFTDESASCSMVVNASNREKIWNWISKQLQGKSDLDVRVEDRTLGTAMIAVQGPVANELVAKLAELNPAELGYYSGAMTKIGDVELLISRTGYTGEDGCEIIVAAENAAEIWSKIAELGEGMGLKPAGLGARDTLRMEAAMPLYGHELGETINPAQCDLNFALTLKDRDFVGRDAIAKAKEDPELPCRVGLVFDGKRAAREHSKIMLGDNEIGEVTSGTYSPTLEKSIAMGFVVPANSTVGTQVEIDIRGKRQAAEIVALPFYQRPRG